jgi:pilus assembly protein Flp/PilA
MRKQFKQLGQGMTEYIIIIALIAIAAIGAFTFFGDGLKETVGTVTEELTGKDSTITQSDKGDERISTTRDMGDFTESDK